MRKLRPKRSRDWLFMMVFMEPHRAPVWLHICECYRPCSTDCRLGAWSSKVGPVLKAHGAWVPQKNHFLLETLRGVRHYPGDSQSLEVTNKMHVVMREMGLGQLSGRPLGVCVCVCKGGGTYLNQL